MANLLHFKRRVFTWRDYNIIVRGVITRVGLAGSAHGIDVDGELASQINSRWKLEINLSVEQHLMQRLVVAGSQSGVRQAMALPDLVQSCLFVKTLDQRKRSCEPRGIGRQVRIFDFRS